MNDQKAALAQLARHVAQVLGPGWSASQDEYAWRAVELTHADGRSLVMKAKGARMIFDTRLYTGCLAPQDQEPTAITVAAARGPVVMATEIRRRLLPADVRMRAKVDAYRQARDAEKRARAAALEALASKLPSGSVRTVGHAPDRLFLYLPTCGGEFYMHHSADTVDVTLNGLPAPVAERLAAFLRDELTASAV